MSLERISTVESYRVMVEQVRLARLRYAREFARAKSHTGTTDGQAHQAAIEATNDELTTLQAEVEIARMQMEKAQ